MGEAAGGLLGEKSEEKERMEREGARERGAGETGRPIRPHRQTDRQRQRQGAEREGGGREREKRGVRGGDLFVFNTR